MFNPVQRYASSPRMVLRNENNFKGYGGLIVIVTRTRTASAVCTREITGVDGANENRLWFSCHDRGYILKYLDQLKEVGLIETSNL